MLICPPYYSMNDDVMMKSILSGAYTGTPDGHAIYMKYPLTGVLSLLYRILPVVPWFEAFMSACFLVAITAVVVRVQNLLMQTDGRLSGFAWSLVAGVGMLVLALFLPQVFTLHYTLVAAMVGSCGLLLFLTGGGSMSIILLLLSFCIRSQVFFLLLPFAAVVVLWNLIDKDIRIMGRQILVLGIGIVICMAWNGIMYRSADWKQYEVYNDSRTRLYDYDKLLPYEGNEADFEKLGISEMQHRLMDEYVLVLADDITPEMMNAAAQLTASRKASGQSFSEQLIYCVKEYYYHLRYNDGPYNYLLMAGYAGVFILLIRRKEWWKTTLLGCMFGGRSLIWVYLIWQGRFPERVYISLYFIDLMILAGMLLQLLKECRIKRVYIGVCIAVSAVLLGVGISQCMIMTGRARVHADRHEEWMALKEYCSAYPEDSFFIDVYSTVDYSGKVWERAVQQNDVLAGGWMSGSPLLEDKVAELKEKDCYYIISAKRDVDWLFEYCNQRLNGVQIEKTDSISLDGEVLFDIYRQVER